MQSYVVKAESAPELPEKGVVSGKLNCAMGLVEMEAGKFKKAANFFLATPFEMGTNYSEVGIFCGKILRSDFSYLSGYISK